MQGNRSQQVLEKECFPEFPKDDPDQGRVARSTHNTHRCTHTHMLGHGTGHGHKCLQILAQMGTQGHVLKVGTHVLLREVLTPRARASLPSVLVRGGIHEGTEVPLDRSCALHPEPPLLNVSQPLSRGSPGPPGSHAWVAEKTLEEALPPSPGTEPEHLK